MSSNGRPGEPRFNIQPHPANTNNPADLDPQSRRDFNENPAVLAHHARDPYIPSQDVVNNLGAPLSREELKRRSEELNRDQ